MPHLPTIEEEGSLPWLRLMWRYRLQFQAMAAPSVIFIAGGMKMAWSIFLSPVEIVFSSQQIELLTISWFVGIIFGAIVASFYVQRTTKNVAFGSSGLLLLLAGLLFAICPISFSALLIGGLCEGCAFGMTQVQALVTGSEVAHKDIRGLILSFERSSLWFGILLQLLWIQLWNIWVPSKGHTLHHNQVYGILVICLSLIALSLTAIHRIESPLLLQFQHRDCAVTLALKRLHGVQYTSTDVLRMRDDCKQLLTHDSGMSAWQAFVKRNLRVLLQVVVMRCFAMLSLTLPYNHVFLTASWGGNICKSNCLLLLGLNGFLGSVLGGLLIDEHGRRKLSVISSQLAGIFIFIAGGVFRHIEECNVEFPNGYMEMATWLLLLHQFATCTGSPIASVIYTAEAFTVSVKAKCIAAVLVCEQLLQISLILIVFHVRLIDSMLLFTFGSVSLLMGLFMFLFMPETKLLQLNESLLKFRRKT